MKSVTRIDQVPLLAVVADLHDRGVRHLQRARLAQKAGADRLPVPVGAAPQHADRHWMPERAVRAPEHLAAEAPWAEPLANLVGPEQAACGGKGRHAGHHDRRSAAVARLQRRRERGHRVVAILG